MLTKRNNVGIVICMTTILTFPVTMVTGASSNNRQSGAVPRSMSHAQFTALIQEAEVYAQAAEATGSRDEAQSLMKLAQKALEKARESRAGHVERVNEAIRALRQAVEQAENQEAIKLVRHSFMNLSQSIGL